MSLFVHLHVHTQYSILDGASAVKTLVRRAKELGMTALAITDHGNMFGVKEFHDAATAASIKPIIGCEIYVARTSLEDKTSVEDRSGDHLILLAKNKTGYRNLVRLVSEAWIRGFYYKPRIDKELLRKHREGLIASSACIAGEAAQEILTGNIRAAEESILSYREIFGDDYFLEIQRHETTDPTSDVTVFPQQQRVIAAYRELAAKHNIKIIASNDVHFIMKDDAEAHDRLICLNTGKDIDDQKRLRYTKQEYLKSAEEMLEIFADIPEAVSNTVELADRVENYKLNSEPIMPEFTIPGEFADKDEYLRHLTMKGAAERWNTITPDIQARIDFELSVIKNMGFPGYFLIVQDFLRAAREMGVWVGPGRGSAAGSVVAYSLRITDIDPVKYNLLFERFLNPDRISMPDIDIDFDEDGREKVLRYVVEKYGHDRVAHIITFGTMAAKMAIRDVARVQKLPLPEAIRLTKLVPDRPGTTLASAYEEVPELLKEKESKEPLVAQTLKYAEVLEGSIRQTGVHACGIIIGKDSLSEHIPICTAKDTDLYVTQYEGNHVESVGLLKMDFLGLKTLSIMKDAVDNIEKSKGITIDLQTLELDDRITYELFSNGETTGVFQFESVGMKRYLRELKPNQFGDLIAMNALYRPGPMDYIPQFIRRKHGKEKISYEVPAMEKYLKETYGITVYQEQVMLLSQELGGFSKGQADSLRKAMGKKKRDIMDRLKEQFIEGCRMNGYDQNTINKIWSDWESFAEYAFNKSHSTCYALIAYQTGYLKAHYPAEFMAAVLSRNISDIKKITVMMEETRRMGTEVLGPDVNESYLQFTVNRNGNIRFGLGAIKGVGENAVLHLIEEREKNGPYKDIYDLAERVNLNTVNKKMLEAMVVSGALDGLPGMTRAQYFAADGKGSSFLESLIRFGNNVKNIRNSTQQSLFGDTGGFDLVRPEPAPCPDWSKLERLNKEKEVIGIYLSSHPLDDFRLEISTFCNATLADLQNLSEFANREVCVAGIVSDTRSGVTRNGKPFGGFTLQDYTDSFSFLLFDKDYVAFSNYFRNDYQLLVKGRVQGRHFNPEELEFKIKEIHLLTAVREDLITSITIKLKPELVNPEFIKNLKSVISENPGNKSLKFLLIDHDERITIPLFSRSIKAGITDELIGWLEDNPELGFKVN
ncbi:MAG TPA: DNA polymerase III subunit alpha [Bacteroidales bacterium]|jgi:DNA polymerase-3 subunit alpha|nr:DNA polymerase III subunit alpha [Bacteroidales bacterium]HNX83594.1 DNA polymerase III subunit alpha [Bacteroidales bacterium]